MTTETAQLIETIEAEASVYEDTDVVLESNEFYNWQSDKEGCDVELKIGPYADIVYLIQSVRAMENWVIRWITTGDPGYDHQCIVTLVSVSELVDASGITYFEQIFGDKI